MEKDYVRLHPEDIEFIAHRVCEMMYDDLSRMIQNVENIAGTIYSIASEVQSQGNQTRSQVRDSAGGLSGQLYSILSRVESIRR
jgi:hypothetical protein